MDLNFSCKYQKFLDMKPLLNIWLNAGLNLILHLLTLSLPNEAEGKFRPNFNF